MSALTPSFTPHLFTDWVSEQIRRGFGLVPFVGSGMSAASGIITAQDFQNLLAWATFRCVAPVKEQPRHSRYRHDLRAKGWPSPPRSDEMEMAVAWIEEVYERCKQESGPLYCPIKPEILERSEARRESGVCPIKPEVGKSDQQGGDNRAPGLLNTLSRRDALRNCPASAEVSVPVSAYIEESAIRSLENWRTTLHFLARLRLEQKEEADGSLISRLWLSDANDIESQVIIDAFNRHVTGGKEPSLAHTMLCHLATRTRVRTILTTNFDDLLEKAFERLGEAFGKAAVHLNDPLPDPELVHSRNLILKLHGDLSQTRADDSLDLPPSPEDKRRFFHYVRGRYPEQPAGTGFLPALLFVCGYSASDQRCVQLIKYLLHRDEQALVVWICHTPRDLENLGSIFHEQGYSIAATIEDLAPGKGKARIVATLTDRADLLFYELYQRLTLSLPRGGFNYQFNHNVPPATSFKESAPEKRDEDAARLVNSLVEEHKRGGKVVVADGPSGLTAPLRQAFHRMVRDYRYRGLWLELEDYANPRVLAHEIFARIAIRLGRFQLSRDELLPSNLAVAKQQSRQDEWLPCIEGLLRTWNIEPSEWLIVLYGRNGPGGCAGWEQRYWSNEGDFRDYDALSSLLRALRQARLHDDDEERQGSTRAKGGFLVLYAPYSTLRYNRDIKRQEGLHTLARTMTRTSQTGVSSESSEFRAWRRDRSLSQNHRIKGIIPPHDYSSDDVYGKAVLFKQRDTTFVATLKHVRKRLLLTAASKAPPLTTSEAASAKGNRSDPIAAQRFLYSAALFRQSRHFSALLSEATYPCPLRYNIRGEDNDWHRSHHVWDWLVSLHEQCRLLFWKPGGFAWMYRDTRLGIQCLAQALPPAAFGDQSIFAAQGRARIHYWIGDWYGRAYRSTGHVMPLLESVYHYRQCIDFVKWAKPGSIDPSAVLAYRRRLARRALFELIKTLQHGRERTIDFWLQEGAGDPWFSLQAKGGGRQMLQKLEVTFRALAKSTPRAPDFAWEAWLAELGQELRRLPQLHRTTIPALGTRPARLQHTLFPSADIHHTDVDAATEADWRLALRRVVAPKLAPIFSQNTRQQPKTSSSDRAWLSLLALLADHAGSASGAGEPGFDLNKKLRGWRDQWIPKLRGDRGRVEAAARTIFDIAYLHVRRAKLAYHAKHESQSNLLPEKQIASLWVQVCGLCWLVLDLCAELPPVALNVDFELRIAASTIYGLALGRLGRFFEAHRRLNEAHAILFAREWGASASPELAKIKLRRAEVHVLEARLLHRMLRLFTGVKPDKLSFEDFLQQRAGVSRAVAEQCVQIHFPDPHSAANATRELKADKLSVEDFLQQCGGVSRGVAEQWFQIHLPNVRSPADAVRELERQHYAKLDDAWLSLDTAQKCLKATHAALWWGRLYALRLLVFAERWCPANASADPETTILAFRHRGDPVEAVRKLFSLGTSASRASRYTTIRLLDYVAHAANNLRPCRPQSRHSATKLLRKVGAGLNRILEDTARDPDSPYALPKTGYLRDYFQNVDTDVKKFLAPNQSPAGPSALGT